MDNFDKKDHPHCSCCDGKDRSHCSCCDGKDRSHCSCCDGKDRSHCSCCSGADIIASVALEEAALSHILNAEGEKIQKALAIDGVTIDELLCVNESVVKTIREVTSLELVLLGKLESACACDKKPPCPHPPCPPPHPCCEGKISVFVFDCCTKCGISGVKICIFKCRKLVAKGSTDECGRFTSCMLPCGEYTVKICPCDDAPCKVRKVVITEHCNKELCVCFERELPCPPPCPPPCPVRTVSIKGKVSDKCGNPIAARVTAIGKEKVEVCTDGCGNFEICCLQISDNFSIFATCKQGCCKGITRTFFNVCDARVMVNLML